MLDDAQINDSVTDTSTAVHLVEGWIGEGTKWNVLEWELVFSRILNPASEGSACLSFNHNLFLMSLMQSTVESVVLIEIFLLT